MALFGIGSQLQLRIGSSPNVEVMCPGNGGIRGILVLMIYYAGYLDILGVKIYGLKLYLWTARVTNGHTCRCGPFEQSYLLSERKT